MRGYMRLAFWVAMVTFVLDQATKWWVVHALDLKSRIELPVLRGLVTFRMAWNRGVNFGIGGAWDLRWVLVALSVAISVGVLVWLRRVGGSRLTHAAAGLLVGGAFGNIVDRVTYGAVADFLNVTCCGIANPYSFNVADIAIFAGAFGLVLFADGKAGSPPRDGGATAR